MKKLYGLLGLSLGLLLGSGAAALAEGLAASRSPYLRDNADSPIRWQEWGEAAFAVARELDRPIFLSIGYLTCRGCQVLKEETFSQPEVVDFLNDHFVPVLVDREERPDVDRVYQAFVAGTTGRGGWPLNVWLTPDLEPYLGGTYFPPTDRPGMPSLLSTARLAHRGWSEDRSNVTARAQSLRHALETLAAQTTAATASFQSTDWRAVARQYIEEYDPIHGGFGTDTKFPHAAKIHYLLRFATAPTSDPELQAEALHMALSALRVNVSSPLRDSERGGFHRYTTDRAWQQPHYEMMLYDQAFLLEVLLDAYLLTADSFWRDAIVDLVEFVRRELTRLDGAFASSFNAVNTPEEGVPLLDDKMVAAWNGQMIAALARAAVTLDRNDWLEAAKQAAERVRNTAMDLPSGVLRRLDDGQPGFAEDYASLIRAWLTLYESTFDVQWLDEARQWQSHQESRFGDPAGGYFSTEADAADVLIRMKEDFDGAEPSANSVAASNLRRLYSLTGDSAYLQRADTLFQHFASRPFSHPAAMPVLLAESMLTQRPALQIVIAGDPQAEDTRALLQLVRHRFLPGAVVMLADPTAVDASPPAYTEGMETIDGQATAYVCENFVCRLPVIERADLAALLDEHTPRSRLPPNEIKNP